MKNLGKTALICAIIFFVFVIAGGICFGIGVANTALGGDVISNISGYIDGANDILHVDSDNSALSISQKYTLSDNIKEIELDNVCGNITITPSATNIITADYNGPANLLNNGEITFKEDGDTLKISFGKNIGGSLNFGGISIGSNIGDFELYIPADYSGSLEISTAAGAADISGFSLNNLEIKNVAGEINLYEMTADELSLNNTVGEVNVSGKIGAVDISDNIGECYIECSSPFTDDCEIENNLGEINIYLPSHARINVESSNILGEVNVDNSLESSSGVNFEISSCLGEIEITAK